MQEVGVQLICSMRKTRERVPFPFNKAIDRFRYRLQAWDQVIDWLAPEA